MQSSALIRNCGFKFKCEQSWELLEPIKYLKKSLVRYCSKCDENVYFVEDERSLLMAIENNRCVAIPFDITYRKKLLDKMGEPLLGSVRIQSGLDESN